MRFGILLICMFVLTACGNIQEACCNECVLAGSQSAEGVGPEAMNCGQFGSASPVNSQCASYFEENPMTLEGCGSV